MVRKNRHILIILAVSLLIISNIIYRESDRSISDLTAAENKDIIGRNDKKSDDNNDEKNICKPDFEAMIGEMSSASYRRSVKVDEDSFVVVRQESDNSEGIESAKWYSELGVTDYEVLSEYASGDGKSVVTYSLTIENKLGVSDKLKQEKEYMQDVWDVIDKCNSSGDCQIAEPVYEYYICGMEDEIDNMNMYIKSEKNDPDIGEQWYLEDQGCDRLWDEVSDTESGRAKGKDVIVAVVDTGVDYTHEDLADNMWINEPELNGTKGVDDDGNGIIDDIYGAAFDDESDDPMDENGHGTHVAGIIAMSDNNVGGIGLAPNTKIMAIKAAGNDGIFRSTDIARAILYASSMGADVINMSFGSYAHSAVVEEACQEAYGKCIMVSAAGNESYPTADSPITAKGNQYPACYPYVLGVMAHDKDHKLASFSNWDYLIGDGPEYEIAAPGVSMYSTLPSNTYGTKSGTSMATAVVSAAVAVVKSNMPDGVKCSTRYIMDNILTASKQTVGSYKRICLKDCYDHMAALCDKYKENDDQIDNEVEQDNNEENEGSDYKDDINTGMSDSTDGKNDSFNEYYDDSDSIILESSISENMTLESGICYVIDKAVVVEEGVTVNVNPGARLKFWDGDPKQASTANPFSYIEVKGCMNFNGTKEKPVILFPDKAFSSYRVEIRNSGIVNMEYVSIVNPYISINEGNHLKLSQDYDTVNYRGRDDEGKLHMYKGGVMVEADNVRCSTMSDLRYIDDSVSKSKVSGNFDTVQFDNCRVCYESVKANNCVFLMDKARIQNQAGVLEYAGCDENDSAGLEYAFCEGSDNNIFLNNRIPEIGKSDNEDNIESIDGMNSTYYTDGIEHADKIYPYVDNIYIIDQYRRKTSAVADGEVEIHVVFNRSMDMSVCPEVSFGADDPYTDYVVNGNFLNDKEWSGKFNINTKVYQGDMYLRVKKAAAADDGWLITGMDWARYGFVIDPLVEKPDNSSGEGDGSEEKENDNPDEASEQEDNNSGDKENTDEEDKQEDNNITEENPENVKTGTDIPETGNDVGQSESDTDIKAKEDIADKQEKIEDEKAGFTANSNLINSGFKVEQKGSKLTVKWKSVAEADGYYVYAAYSGKKFGKPIKIIAKSKASSANISKINGKKLNVSKVFKVYVKAYKKSDGKERIIAKTITGYVVGRKNTTYTNVKKIKLEKTSYTVKRGKTKNIKAGITFDNKKMKELPSKLVKRFRYVSDDENTAKVDNKGRIKGVRAGSCVVYVYAPNGNAKKIKVTVNNNP